MQQKFPDHPIANFLGNFSKLDLPCSKIDMFTCYRSPRHARVLDSLLLVRGYLADNRNRSMSLRGDTRLMLSHVAAMQ